MKKILLFLLAATTVMSLVSCSGMFGQTSGETKFKSNQKKDAGDPVPAYDRLVQGIGEEKTLLLSNSLGKGELDRLTYGVGSFNMIDLVNRMNSTDKLLALLGSNYPEGFETGLGVSRILALINSIDAMMDEKDWNNTNMSSGDTIGILADFVNGVTETSGKTAVENLNEKVVGLINGMGIPRDMGLSGNDEAKLNAKTKINQLAKMMAHVKDTNKIITIINSSTAAEVTANLKDIIVGVTESNNLIQVLDQVSDASKMVTLIKDVSDASKIVTVMNSVLNMDKLSTLVNDVDSISKLATVMNGIGDAAKLVTLMNNVSTISKLKDVIDGVTNATDLITVVNGVDSVNMVKLSEVMEGITDTSKLVALMNNVTDKARIVTLVNDVNESEIIIEVMNGVTGTTKIVSLMNEITPDVSKLVAVMNGMTAGNGSKLSYTVQNVNDVATLISLINGITTSSKLADLMNEMEDNSTWTGQVVQQQWNATAGTPSGADSGMVRLVALVNGLSSTENVVKLIHIMNNVSDMSKMMRIVQDVKNNDDMINLIRNLPATGTPLPVASLSLIMESTSLNNIVKMKNLVDGQRAFSNTGDQAAYLGKLVTLIQNLDENGPAKVSELLNGVTNIDKVIDLTYDVTNIANLSNVLNGVNQTAVDTLVYMVEQISDISKMVAVINDVTPTNVVSLVNNVDSGTPNGTEAGQKLNAVIDGTDTVTNLIFIMNNVNDFGKMATLINTLEVDSTPKLATLINAITGTNGYDSNDTASADGMGKLVNMIDNISNLGAVATLVDDITDSVKLSDMVNNVTNSNLMVTLVNAVISASASNASDLVGMVNGLDRTTDIPKVVQLLTDLNGTKDTLIAELLAPQSGFSQGVGYATMVTLMQNLTDAASATTLASLMTGLNDDLKYQSATPNITSREGMVRMLTYGLEYSGVTFPGIGPVHVAVMMNESSDASKLATIMNGAGLELMVPLVGCADHVESPDFRTSCTAIGFGW